MDMSAVNWLAVIACVVFAMLSGMFWYHPRVFYPAWRQGLGKSDEEMGANRPGPVMWALTILAAFVEAASVAFLMNTMGATTLTAGAGTAFMLWLGFVAPTSLVNKLFAGHGLKVWAIEAGNHLLNMLVFGAILGAWR